MYTASYLNTIVVNYKIIPTITASLIYGQFDSLLRNLFWFSVHVLSRNNNSKFFRSQIGPGIVYLFFDCPLGRGAFLQSLTPVEPLQQKMIHQVWFNWYFPPIFAKFFLLAEAMMVCLQVLSWRIQKSPLASQSETSTCK